MHYEVNAVMLAGCVGRQRSVPWTQAARLQLSRRLRCAPCSRKLCCIGVSCCFASGLRPTSPRQRWLRWLCHLAAAGVWRNGSASDSRSEGWEFESLCPHSQFSEVRCPFCFLCCFRCCGAVPSWVALRRVRDAVTAGLPLASSSLHSAVPRLACELSVCLLLASTGGFVRAYARPCTAPCGWAGQVCASCAPWWRCRRRSGVVRGSVSSPARDARWPSGSAANTCCATWSCRVAFTPHVVGSRSQAGCLERNTAMDDSIGGS